MNGAIREQSSAQEWEQELVEDYYDYRWRQLMEPICDKMQRWKSGGLSHEEMSQSLEECHQNICEVRNILGQRRDRLVTLIQWLDRDWFLGWVGEHTPPADVRLATADQTA